ncbi:MAG: S24 family peptidase [Delftia lacustris]|uniref:LexA family protein n=1 Tax=Delftia TaxID=80865 RepID=UPI00259C6A26|nr:S24 family peptidase [Delftia sp.]
MLDNTADLIRARLSAAFDKWVASDLTRTKKQLAQLCQDALGVPCTPQTVNGWFKTGRMDKKWIPVLADVLGVNLLSGNDGPPFDANVRPAAVGMRAYPVISKIQAGRVKERTAPYEPGDGYAVVFGDDDASPWAFFLEIEGDSMLPDFNEGDLALIDPEVVPRPGDYVAAKNSKRESTFKKYRVRGITDNGHEIFELVPLNPDYPVIRSDEHQLVVIGTMIEHRRKFRRK